MWHTFESISRNKLAFLICLFIFYSDVIQQKKGVIVQQQVVHWDPDFRARGVGGGAENTRNDNKAKKKKNRFFIIVFLG